jgi:hypothetical protein
VCVRACGGSVIADVRYNRVKGYSRKYTAGYIANTCNKHRNTQCDYIKVFILGLFFILNTFLTTEPFLVPQHLSKFTVVHSQMSSGIS